MNGFHLAAFLAVAMLLLTGLEAQNFNGSLSQGGVPAEVFITSNVDAFTVKAGFESFVPEPYYATAVTFDSGFQGRGEEAARRAILPLFIDGVHSIAAGTCVASSSEMSGTISGSQVTYTLTPSCFNGATVTVSVVGSATAKTLTNSANIVLEYPVNHQAIVVTFSNVDGVTPTAPFDLSVTFRVSSPSDSSGSVETSALGDTNILGMTSIGLTRYIVSPDEYASGVAQTTVATTSGNDYEVVMTASDYDGTSSTVTLHAFSFYRQTSTPNGEPVQFLNTDDDDDDDTPIGAIVGGILGGGIGGVGAILLVLAACCCLTLVVVVVVVLVVLLFVGLVVLVVLVVAAVLKMGPLGSDGGPVSKNTQIWWDDTDYEEDEDEDEDEDDDDDDDDDESDIESSDF